MDDGLKNGEKREMRKILNFLSVLIFMLLASGCAAKDWYEDYGVTDLDSNKAIIAAVEAMNKGNKPQRKGAADFLMSANLTEKQADILDKQYEFASNEYTRVRISRTLMEKGFKKQALPGLLLGLNDRNGGLRAMSLRYLSEYGCAAKEALPMIKVVSTNDSLSIQRVAKKTYREISLDCMTKKINIEDVD